MKRIFHVLFFSFVSIVLFSQEVISSAGDVINNSNGSITWALGEPISITINNAGGTITQGFHQPKFDKSNPSVETIPTMGEWGIMICCLLLMNISLSQINNKKEEYNQA